MVKARSRQISTGLAVAVALLAANAVISYRNIQKIVANERWVSHTHEVITKLEQTLSTLKDAETGQRGYLLTGNKRYLEPYQRATATVNQQVQELQRLTQDNPRQQQRLQDLQRQIDGKLAELHSSINLRRARGLNAALREVETNRGKEIMDGIRAAVAKMVGEEKQLLVLRAKESETSIAQTLLTFTIAMGVNLLLLALVDFLIRRDRIARQQEEDIQKQLLHQIEQERNTLQISEARYHSLVSAISQAVWIANPDGNMVDEMNSWEKLTGQTPLEMENLGGINVIHPDDRNTVTTQWLQAKAEKTPFKSEHRVKVLDGSYRYFLARAVPILNQEGQISEWVGIHTDISDRKQSEAEILQLNATLEKKVAQRTLQLQEANAELEGFAYSVAHDLRAPLRGMHGLSQAVLEDYGNLIDELGQEYLQQIVKSAEQLEELIEDLLAYSRLSRTQLQLQKVDLNDIITTAITQIQTEPNYPRAQITISSPLPSVLAHRPTLIQVVVNLLTNALKFTENPQPQIHIWAEALVNDTSPSPHIRLWVEDNGISIAPEHQTRIFRVFERLHGIEAYPGTGIGLAIVAKGIERMGGTVGVESQPGQGSRFWIQLPEARG